VRHLVQYGPMLVISTEVIAPSPADIGGIPHK
jgi:hypothetical protein